MISNNGKLLRFALIGCGAVSEWQHLPSLLKSSDVIVSALVDTNKDRVNLLAQKCPPNCIITDSIDSLAGRIDCAIVALPHYLHAPTTINLLGQGIHVLVEKPMAISTAECHSMIDASNRHNAFLGVGLLRRFFPSSIAIKSIIDSGMLGKITHFDFQEGGNYDWPAASASFFNKKYSGGGVLIDAGAHAIDQLLWWLGDVSELTYRDDAMGGVEAECQIALKMRSGACGTIRLSRLRRLSNAFIINGERASLEVDTAPLAHFKVFWQDKLILDTKQVAPQGYTNGYDEATANQLAAFINGCRGMQSEIATGEIALKSIEIIERCYSVREVMSYPWEDN